MTHNRSKDFRVLAIAPSTRGFGFVVLEGPKTLVDWGVKSVKGDKNAQSLKKADMLIDHYQPDTIVLQDLSAGDCRRAARIRELSQGIIGLASDRKVKVKLFTKTQMRKIFFADGKGTKHALAEILANRFPAELGFLLPPKRRAWMNEDYRIDIFEAVALALVLQLRKENRTKNKQVEPGEVIP